MAMADSPHEYTFRVPGFHDPYRVRSDRPLTDAEVAQEMQDLVGQYGSGVTILSRPSKSTVGPQAKSAQELIRVTPEGFGTAPPLFPPTTTSTPQGLAKPPTPVSKALEGLQEPPGSLLGEGEGSAYRRFIRPALMAGIKPGSPAESVAKFVVPETEAEVLSMGMAPGGGALAMKALSKFPRLAWMLGNMAGGAAGRGGGAAISGDPVGPETAWGAGLGFLGSLLGLGGGTWRRQTPPGILKAGREMAPQIGREMERQVPELAGARTPEHLYEAGRGAAGVGPRIKDAIEEMYGSMIERISQATGGQKLLIPSLLKLEQREIVEQALQLGTATGGMAAQNLAMLRDRFGVTLKQVVSELKARKAAFRSPSQAMTTQRSRASVGEILDEVDADLGSLGLPRSILDDYGEVSRRYRVGKAWLDLLGEKELFAAKRGLLPEPTQRKFAELTAETSRPLAHRMGEEAHTRLSDIIGRGTPPGTVDRPGSLMNLFHLVMGTKGKPMVYTSTGGLSRPISLYAAKPGRLPLETSPLRKLLYAIGSQGAGGRELKRSLEESPEGEAPAVSR